MFDYFAKEKSDFLKKKDKSKKGSIDKDIVGIVNLINSKKAYYTTSSCAGRIVLLEMKSKKKNECDWIFTKHDKVKFNEIDNTLNNYFNKTKSKILELPLDASTNEETCFESMPNYRNKLARSSVMAEKRDRALNLQSRSNNSRITKNKNRIWFKQQPLILHVACRNLDAANKLLEISRKIFRRAGIIGITKRKVMIELIGDERIETIIADKDFVADDNYIKQLIKYANENFMNNKKKSEKFLGVIKSI